MAKVHIVFGPQGAGKSTYSIKLAKELNGVHLSIDNWMWELYGEDQPKSMNLRWIKERVERCEKQIWSLTKSIIHSGSEVILDLAFTKRSKRIQYKSLAQEENIPYKMHFINAPHDLRRKRVLERNIKKGETFAFEVTAGMFDFMETEFHRPTEDELESAIIINTENI